MRLWLLQPTTHGQRPTGPWDPWYDKCFKLVVRAKNQKDARALAEEEHSLDVKGIWLDSTESSCEPLTAKGPAEVVIADTAEA